MFNPLAGVQGSLGAYGSSSLFPQARAVCTPVLSPAKQPCEWDVQPELLRAYLYPLTRGAPPRDDDFPFNCSSGILASDGTGAP